jgi:hypothetical protein
MHAHRRTQQQENRWRVFPATADTFCKRAQRSPPLRCQAGPRFRRRKQHDIERGHIDRRHRATRAHRGVARQALEAVATACKNHILDTFGAMVSGSRMRPGELATRYVRSLAARRKRR